jgi:hypothetical protein
MNLPEEPFAPLFTSLQPKNDFQFLYPKTQIPIFNTDTSPLLATP